MHPASATALGPQRTREELLPYLTETVDDEDELLLVLAEELGNFVDHVGGPAYAFHILKPLECLATVEEESVREQAIQSICKVAAVLGHAHHAEHFIALVRRLVQRDWYTSRISACGLFAVSYPHGSPAMRTEYRGLFGHLCRDDTPMVRRAAAHALGDFAKVLEPDVLKV